MSIKKVKLKELKVGDIFTKELKLRNREAFIVEDFKGDKAICKSRTDNRTVRKFVEMWVFYLRSEE